MPNRLSNPRLRLLLFAISLAAASATLSLALLTLLDWTLEAPSVLRFDLTVQQAIHAHASEPLTAVMLALTWIGAIKIFALSLLCILGFLIASQRKRTAGFLSLSMLGAFLLNETLKLHFHRARPKVPWSIGDEHTFSFPSGHSLFSVVLYGSLAYLALGHARTTRRRYAIVLPAMLLPLGIGISRIYLGMHYPTDVLAGYTVGLLWLAAVIPIDRVARTS